jgi:hypothetical protein
MERFKPRVPFGWKPERFHQVIEDWFNSSGHTFDDLEEMRLPLVLFPIMEALDHYNPESLPMKSVMHIYCN